MQTYSLILQPTRVTSTSATLIDNIFINDMSCHSTGGNITSSVSNHYFQFSQLDIFESLKNKYTIKYARDYRNFNKREFSEELSRGHASGALSDVAIEDTLKVQG